MLDDSHITDGTEVVAVHRLVRPAVCTVAGLSASGAGRCRRIRLAMIRRHAVVRELPLLRRVGAAVMTPTSGVLGALAGPEVRILPADLAVLLAVLLAGVVAMFGALPARVAPLARGLGLRVRGRQQALLAAVRGVAAAQAAILVVVFAARAGLPQRQSAAGIAALVRVVLADLAAVRRVQLTGRAPVAVLAGELLLRRCGLRGTCTPVAGAHGRNCRLPFSPAGGIRAGGGVAVLAGLPPQGSDRVANRPPLGARQATRTTGTSRGWFHESSSVLRG